MYDIITFGSATQDLILKPKHVTNLHYEKSSSQKDVCFPIGSKVDVEDMQFYSGGGGTNTAATFAAQGFKTGFCGMVGHDVSGQEIINELKGLKINTALVQKTDKKRTNHSVIILQGGTDRTILAYRGAAELMEAVPFRKLKSRWLYLAPMSGLLCDKFEVLIDYAKERGVKVAVNPGMAQLSLPNFAQIAQKIDVLIMNQEEASFLTKIAYENEHEIFNKIDEMCSGVTVMTKGGEGVVVSDGKYLYSAKPAADRKVVDTTGAGDAFGSGFVSEFMKSGDIEKSIQLGMANSQGCLSQIGAKHGLLKKGQEFARVEVVKEEIL